MTHSDTIPMRERKQETPLRQCPFRDAMDCIERGGWCCTSSGEQAQAEIQSKHPKASDAPLQEKTCKIEGSSMASTLPQVNQEVRQQAAASLLSMGGVIVTSTPSAYAMISPNILHSMLSFIAWPQRLPHIIQKSASKLQQAFLL